MANVFPPANSNPKKGFELSDHAAKEMYSARQSDAEPFKAEVLLAAPDWERGPLAVISFSLMSSPAVRGSYTKADLDRYATATAQVKAMRFNGYP